MSCPDAEKIELYIQGKLEGEELTEFETHSMSCPECQSKIQNAKANELLLSELKLLHNQDSSDYTKSMSSQKEMLTKGQAQKLLGERYVVVKKVSHDMQRDVFQAVDSELGRPVAIKFLQKNESDDSISEEQWREASLMCKVRHPNIAHVYDVGKQDGIRFIVMEWVEGLPVTEAWKGVPLRQKLDIYMNIVSAIAEAHQVGVIHRDIKPSNIRTTSKYEPKVLDFGVSIETEAVKYLDQSIYRGSPFFTAPEQITCPTKISPATDVFTLGILLYQLLTDVLPFPQKNVTELFDAIVKENPKKPRAVKGNIPKPLQDICLKAMEKDPDNRYSNAQDLLREIESYLQSGRIITEVPSLEDRRASSATKEYFSEGPFVSDIGNEPVELPLTEGITLGERFHIIEKLGDAGSVYHAHDNEKDRDIAIKIVAVSPGQKQATAQQLKQELRLRDDINDFTHVIRAYDVHPVAYQGLSLLLLTMEYASAGSLRSWLNEHKNNKKLRMSKGLDLFKQACLGVQAVHDAGWAYWDAKPENFLLCKDDDEIVVKICDFGLSRNLEHLSVNISPEIQSGRGDPRYISPELIDATRRKDIGQASDIYSVNIVLFEILEGKLPFRGTPAELHDKHLNLLPPQLKEGSNQWRPIVERGLAKAVRDRYVSVEQLVSDLGNVRRGFSLSVDVACPSCGHINTDPRNIFCGKCNKKLPDSFFRPCTRCAGPVRLDQEDCPNCDNRGVAAYYLLEERKKKVEGLKDEDPIEAIELLEIIFREDAGDFSKRAKELINDLRQKQKRISPLTSKAKTFTASGEIEQAIKCWREVLEIIPRHRIAIERADELESVMENFKGQRGDVAALMDAAQFGDAEKLLQNCLELIPNRQDTTEELKNCRKRAKNYVKAFEQASKFVKQKSILLAEKEARKALLQAPNSGEALAMVKTLSNTTDKVKELTEQINHQLSWAEFTKADETFNQIEQLLGDKIAVSDIKAKLTETRDFYISAMTDVQLARDAHDLGKANQEIKRALKLCPDSVEANSLLDHVKADQLKAMDLLKKATPAIKAARFDEAENILHQTQNIWVSVEGMGEKRNLLATSQTEYNVNIKKAHKAKSEKKLILAQEKVESALSICPDSPEANSLSSQIGADQQRAMTLLEKATATIKAARFDEAESILHQIQTIWPSVKGLEEKRNLLATSQTEYNVNIKKAHKAKNEKKLILAQEEVESALSICPDSPEANSLSSQVEADQRKAMGLLEKTTPMIKAARFDEAENTLHQIQTIWPSVKGLEKKRNLLATSETEYNVNIEDARKAEGEKDLTLAQEKIESVLSICPDSTEASEFIDSIKWLQDKTLSHLNDARKLCEVAEFDKASEQLESARQIWLKQPDIEEIREQIATTTNGFHKHISSAERQLDDKKYQQALNSCGCALELCPKSSRAKSLYDEIRSKEIEAEERNKRRIELIRIIFQRVIVVICLPFVAIAKSLPYIGKGLLSIGKGFLFLGKSLLHIARSFLNIVIFVFSEYGKWIGIIAGIIVVGGGLIIGGILGVRWLFTTPAGQGILALTVLVGCILAASIKWHDNHRR